MNLEYESICTFAKLYLVPFTRKYMERLRSLRIYLNNDYKIAYIFI